MSCLMGGDYSHDMKRWEYATVPLLVHATKQILDTWGQDGWELVQVVPGPNPEKRQECPVRSSPNWVLR